MAQAISFDITSGVNKMVRGIREDQKKNIPIALSQTINKTVKKARTEADKEIRKELNLPKKRVFKGLTIFKSNRRKLVGRLVASGGAIPLIDFKARQTKKGVGFKVKKEKGRRLLKGAFIATMRNGHRGVFTRSTKSRLPIKEAFSTSIPQAFSNKKIKESLVKLGGSFFFPEFGRNLGRLLKKRPVKLKG